MKQSHVFIGRTAFAIILVLLIAACSTASFRHEPFDNFGVDQRAVTQELGQLRVRASVPGEEEAEKIFGIPIYERGIQPVWLEITNHSAKRARIVHVSVDPEYFSPLEVAYMHKKHFSKQGWMDLEKYLYKNAIPRHIAAGATESGFIFTHASQGTKAINLDIFYTGEKAKYEQFTFFVEVPGFVPDHQEVDFKALYAESEIQEVDVDGLRTVLESLPCCTTNRDGSGQGQPVSVALVASGGQLLQALLRAGWSETSYSKDDNYLNNTDYLFGRPPDAIFRKGRNKTTERNELGLWVAPIKVNGEPLWMVQIKHAIGRRYQIGELFFGSRQDPDVDDGRNYLLQNIWYSQSLKEFAYSETGKVVPVESPIIDFKDNFFFTDGTRIVMWISGEPVALQDARFLQWKRLEDL